MAYGIHRTTEKTNLGKTRRRGQKATYRTYFAKRSLHLYLTKFMPLDYVAKGQTDDLTLQFVPVACYAYTVGENTIQQVRPLGGL